jgi:hypothetical protein
MFTVVVLSVLAGCDTGDKKPIIDKNALLAKGKELLTVDFQEARTLRYKFVSSRDITVDWEPAKSKTDKNALDRTFESLDLVVAYTPLKIDTYGLTTIKATCESAKAKRTKGRRKDATEGLAGKTFTFTVDPTGKIADHAKLNSLIREIGKTAFRADSARGRVKEPDMIGDFTATQWFLWDSVSSIENASEGVSVGQTWKSMLSIPTPMVTLKVREVTYTLDKIRPTDKGRLAVISSTYAPADSIPAEWPPMPYSGSFQMSGTFGFLRGYRLLSVEGQGQDIFNIDAGRIEQYKQQLQTKWNAGLPFGLKTEVSPEITIKQTLTMQLLKD